MPTVSTRAFARRLAIAGAIIAMLCAPANTLSMDDARAATLALGDSSFVVDSVVDAVDVEPGDGTCETAAATCTLRAAIQEANALAGADAVILPAGTFMLTIADAITDPFEPDDHGLSGDLDILDDVTITGSGRAETIIDGARTHRIFHVPGTATVSISSLTIQNSGSVRDGGGLFNELGNVTLSDMGFWDNRGDHGAAIWNGGTLSVMNSTLTNNVTATEGGGIFNWYDGIVTLDGVLITHNGAEAAGGIAMYGGHVTLVRSEVSWNEASDGAGGGIANWLDGTLIVIDSTISHNQTLDSSGGGIFTAGPTTLRRVVLAENHADKQGGGLSAGFPFDSGAGGNVLIEESLIIGNDANFGGGIAGLATIRNSAIIGNFAYGIDSARGGGIDGGGTLVNVTVSGNSARGFASEFDADLGRGSGLYLTEARLTNVTVTENAAAIVSGEEGTGLGDGIFVAGRVTITNSIVANNGEGGDCSGTLASQGHNLDSDASCGLNATGDQSGVDPLLGPLQANGGLTPTHALLPGGPAIDAGTNADCPSTDQRGVVRPLDGDGDGTAICDIGAVEAPARYQFTGFFQPVDNLPAVNTVKAGAAIPIRFSLGGDQGLDILADGSPTSQRIACDTAAPADAVEETATAGSSSLTYDMTTETYTYVWKTDKRWAKTCRQFTLTMSDGSTHTATFAFR